MASRTEDEAEKPLHADRDLAVFDTVICGALSHTPLEACWASKTTAEVTRRNRVALVALHRNSRYPETSRA